MADAHNPLAQFVIKPLITLPPVMGHDISFTNASLYMVLAVLTITLLFAAGTARLKLIPGRMQSFVEMSYQFIANLVTDTAGKEGLKYFPFVFTLFFFILACNLLGMTPYSFTVTSHIAVTFALAAVIFLGVTLIAIFKHGPVAFLSFFFPKGIHWSIALLMFPIELISYLARPISLSVRLAANMMAGHTMLKVIAGFVIALGALAGWLPFAFLLVIIIFEVAVAILQAYIFTILTCVYLNDALHLH